MDIKKELGAKIKELRSRRGLSQKELGRLLNRSHAAISDLERGKTDLTVSDLLLLAKSLATPVTYLLNIQSSSSNISIQYSGTIKSQEDSGDIKVNITDNVQKSISV